MRFLDIHATQCADVLISGQHLQENQQAADVVALQHQAKLEELGRSLENPIIVDVACKIFDPGQ